jgi:hypothetical protein
MIGTLLAFFAVGLVALLVAGAVLSIVGILFSMTFSLAGFLLFKAAPVLLVGWVAVKIFAKMTGGGSLSAADRKWLGE